VKILVVGATGATGQLLVKQLLGRKNEVVVIVRPQSKLPQFDNKSDNLSVVSASVLDISSAEMIEHVNGCDAVVSCLGHNLSLKGVYGRPCRLVTDATRLLCSAIEAGKSKKPTKFILMNTAGNSNRDLNESLSFSEKCVLGLIRFLLPPQADNEKAADYLLTSIGKNNKMIEWAAVRPDTLVDEVSVTDYEVYQSPIRSAIFNPGRTSRINVGHFIADLITDDNKWKKWKGQMPVIYGR